MEKNRIVNLVKYHHWLTDISEKENPTLVKKLTDKKFLELVIDKELEIAGADVRFKDLEAMTKEQQEEYKFFNRFSFNTSEEFLEWRQFFYDHFYDWQPKYVNKKTMEREFAWFNLQWGLKSDFPYEQIIEYDNALKKNK